MSARSFLDTNILVYTDDHEAPAKQASALGLFEQLRTTRNGVLSTQVLQEYFVAATKKLSVDPAIARRKVELFARLDLVRIDIDTIVSAIDLTRLHAVSFWDALIIRAALSSGCKVLFSENMQSGRRIDGLQILNPFA
ncbi:MAG: PIN domain-containing protein [Acidiferrobacterales bacterium]